MGLMDFLATAGQGRQAGRVAQAFGGQTDQQKSIANFADNELPKLIENIARPGITKQEIERGGMDILRAWTKAGLPLNEHAEKFMDRLIGPALQGVRDEELSSIQRDYGPQIKPITPMVAPQGQGQPLAPGTTFEPQTTPGKPFDVEGAFRLGRTLGTNAPGYHQLLQTPAEIAQKEASRRKTEQELEARDQLKGGAPVTPGILGTLNPGGLTGIMEGRQLPPELYGQVGKPGFESAVQNFLQTNPNAKREDITALMTQHNAAKAGERSALAGERSAAAGERAAGASERAASATQFNQADKLRDEFNAQSKDFRTVRDSYNRIETASQSPTPAGDLSMLYGYMKMLDPGSVVRESEFRSAATAKPLLERLGLSWDAVGSVWAGQKMTPGMRKDFADRAKQIYGSEAQQHQRRVDEYTRLGKSYNLNPSQIVTEQGATSAPPTGTLGRNAPSQAEIDAAKKRLGIP